MATEPVTMDVDAEAAQAYHAASQDEQKKIALLVSLRIREATTSAVPLQQIMNEISRKAQERGLAPELEHTRLDD